jgi:hypothetical protein
VVAAGVVGGRKKKAAPLFELKLPRELRKFETRGAPL